MYGYETDSVPLLYVRQACALCTCYAHPQEQFTIIFVAATYGNHASHQEISERLFACLALSAWRTADNRRDFVTAQTLIKRLITEFQADLAFSPPQQTR